MITKTDILRLPYTPDLTEGGIAYALRSLAHSYDRGRSISYSRLRHIVASIVVELAFRRHLSQNNIPFDVKAAVPLTERERFDVTLNGRRCNLVSYLISRREQAIALRSDPSILLKAPAIVPSDAHAGDAHLLNDIYIFGFLSGLVTGSQADLQKALGNKKPHHLVHVMPESWRKPQNWNPFGAVTLKSDSDEELIVEVNGQSQSQEMSRCTVSLPPRAKVTLDESFYSITHLHVRRIPEARVGIRCESIEDTHVIPNAEWHNLWVYGMDIFMAGYVSYEEFGHTAKPLLPGSKVYQYEKTRVKNLALPISKLKPMTRLLETMKS